MNRPNTCANLIKAINSLFKNMDTVRLSRAMGNVIVGQMLPDGVVKGDLESAARRPAIERRQNASATFV